MSIVAGGIWCGFVSGEMWAARCRSPVEGFLRGVFHQRKEIDGGERTKRSKNRWMRRGKRDLDVRSGGRGEAASRRQRPSRRRVRGPGASRRRGGRRPSLGAALDAVGVDLDESEEERGSRRGAAAGKKEKRGPFFVFSERLLFIPASPRARMLFSSRGERATSHCSKIGKKFKMNPELVAKNEINLQSR